MDRFYSIALLRLFLCLALCAALSACSTALTELTNGVKMDRANKPDMAREHYTRAIEKDSTLTDAFYNRALISYRTARYREAIPDFSQVVRLKPGDQDAWFYLGRCHAAISDYDSAVYAHTKQIEANPYNANAHYYRAELYRVLKDYKNALADFEIALSFDQYMYWAYAGRARTWLDMDSTDRAFADCNTAIRIATDLMNDLKNAGYNRYWNPQWLPHVADSVQRMAAQNELAAYRIRLGNLYSLRGNISIDAHNYDGALGDFTASLQWDSLDARAYGNMGWVYYLKNDFERCISFSELAVRYDGNALFARYNRALALLRLNRIAEAQQAYRETIDYSDFLTGTGEYNEQAATPSDIPGYIAETVASAKEGAMGDLRELMAKNIQTGEAQAILHDLFGR